MSVTLYKSNTQMSMLALILPDDTFHTGVEIGYEQMNYPTTVLTEGSSCDTKVFDLMTGLVSDKHFYTIVCFGASQTHNWYES